MGSRTQSTIRRKRPVARRRVDQRTSERWATLIIHSVIPNNRTRAFDVVIGTQRYSYPFAKADPAPTSEDPVKSLEIDRECARHIFNYYLASGKDGWVHSEMVLEYNRDPAFLRDNLLYNLTIQAQEAIEKSPLS